MWPRTFSRISKECTVIWLGIIVGVILGAPFGLLVGGLCEASR